MKLHFVFLAVVLAVQCAPAAPFSTNANRLTHLDSDDPFQAGRHYPKLTTPQWVGEQGVDAVVILAIDDMRESAKYETTLRPVLNRLKKIDGRAPASIMVNTIAPTDENLQPWLAEECPWNATRWPTLVRFAKIRTLMAQRQLITAAWKP
jgi:hypothetical protein